MNLLRDTVVVLTGVAISVLFLDSAIDCVVIWDAAALSAGLAVPESSINGLGAAKFTDVGWAAAAAGIAAAAAGIGALMMSGVAGNSAAVLDLVILVVVIFAGSFVVVVLAIAPAGVIAAAAGVSAAAAGADTAVADCAILVILVDLCPTQRKRQNEQSWGLSAPQATVEFFTGDPN